MQFIQIAAQDMCMCHGSTSAPAEDSNAKTSPQEGYCEESGADIEQKDAADHAQLSHGA